MAVPGRFRGAVLLAVAGWCAAGPVRAQQLLDSITGTVTNQAGAYNLFGLPIGTYRVSFSKEGFKTETHSQILVRANRTTTVGGRRH